MNVGAGGPSGVAGQQGSFNNTLADGSLSYKIPILLEPYTYATDNPTHLSYMVITRIDPEQMINHITSKLGGTPLSAGVLENIESIGSSLSSMGLAYDVVFSGGSLNTTSHLLQRADNGKFWFGPYHKHFEPSTTSTSAIVALEVPSSAPSLATGAVPNDQNLQKKDREILLTPVAMPNMKIVDLRDDEELEKVFLEDLYELEDVLEKASSLRQNIKIKDSASKTETKQSFITDHMSQTGNGSYGFILGLDKTKLLFEKSLFKSIANNIKNAVSRIQAETAALPDNTSVVATTSELVDNITKEVLDLSKVTEFNIFRKRVNLNETGENKLGTAITDQKSFINFVLDADIENSYEDAIEEKIATYSEIYNTQNVERLNNFNFSNNEILEKSHLFLTFADTFSEEQSRGQYQYSYEITMEDGIKKYLQQKYIKLISHNQEIDKYINFINSNLPKYYNSVTDRFKVDNISAEFGKDPIIMLASSITDLMSTYWLFNVSAAGLVDFSNLLKICTPDTGNYQGLLKFSSIYETFITRIQNLTGIKNNFLKFSKVVITDGGSKVVFDTQKAAEGSIETADSVLSSNVKSKLTSEPQDSFKIAGNISGIVDLESGKNTGYEYIFRDLTAGASGLREISGENFNQRTSQELVRYYNLGDTNYPGLNTEMQIGRYTTSFFTPIITKIEGITHRTDFDSNQKLIMPDQERYNLYKNIIIDLLHYYFMKLSEKTQSDLEVLNQVKKMLELLTTYGFSFSNKVYRQLGFLTDPTLAKTIEDSEAFVDSSQNKNQQQQQIVSNSAAPSTATEENSTLDSLNISNPPDSPFKIEPISQFINSIATDQVDSLLFGLLNNIILENNKKLNIFADQIFGTSTEAPGQTLGPLNDIGSPGATENSGIEQQVAALKPNTPNAAKSLYINYNPAYAGRKSALMNKGLKITNNKFQEYSLSLETFGWWWFNYSNMTQVHYISNMDSLFRPTWKLLTLEEYNATIGAGKRIICKLSRYTNNEMRIQNNKFLDLPIFNEFFILKPDTAVAPAPVQKTNIPNNSVKRTAITITKIRKLFGDDFIADTDTSRGRTAAFTAGQRNENIFIQKSLKNLREDLKIDNSRNRSR